MVHEDPSTEATQKLPKERMFRKKSILFIAIFCMTTSSVADDWMDAPDKIIDSLRALVEKVKKESDDQSKESAKEFDRHCKSMIKILDR
ncbi:MAG: hypothetical protein LBJ16_01420 [Holosporaceae bacterium]|nr:hypothetical protein [Holosporaceae bacterium]